MIIKLILFDLDGVLIEAKNIHYESLNKSLPEMYNQKKESILRNFELSKKYVIAENYLINNYKNEF